MIRRLLKRRHQRKVATQILDAIRLCQQHLPNNKLRLAMNAMFAIYDGNRSAYEGCIQRLKNYPKDTQNGK